MRGTLFSLRPCGGGSWEVEEQWHCGASFADPHPRLLPTSGRGVNDRLDLAAISSSPAFVILGAHRVVPLTRSMTETAVCRQTRTA
jgi:hypothetical protein